MTTITPKAAAMTAAGLPVTPELQRALATLNAAGCTLDPSRQPVTRRWVLTGDTAQAVAITDAEALALADRIAAGCPLREALAIAWAERRALDAPHPLRVRVRCLEDWSERVYVGLSPARAVIAAAEQGGGNWSTWAYLPPRSHPGFRTGRQTVSCEVNGRTFCALREATA
jgi:hypothetical protein